MDYKEEYQKALERAKKGLPIDEVFPELKESEDERIREQIEQVLIEHDWSATYKVSKDDCLAYLEKQEEQKQIWTKIDNSKENVVFPFNAKVKDSGKVVTIIDGQLNFDGKQWIKFSSNRDDGFKVYCPEDLLVEQKPAEWSEEDEAAFGDLIWCIEQARKSAKSENDMGNIWFAENWFKNRVKSLRPSWKPSEEQIDALARATNRCVGVDDAKILVKLLEQLEKL